MSFGDFPTGATLRKPFWPTRKIYGTYLGKIYGIYKEYIRNIHKYLWYKIIRNTGAAFGGAPMGRPPSAAAPLGLCFWWFSLIDIYGYSLYSPDIFHICFLDMFHVQGGIFPCVFLNLWSQEKISPYSKTTFLLLKFQGLRFLYFY